MSGGEEKKLQNARDHLRAACVIIRAILVVCLAFFILVTILFSALCVLSPDDVERIRAIVYAVLHRALLSAILLLAIFGLSETIRGESPFTLKQSRRFLIAGILFLCVVVLDFILPVEYSINAFSGMLGEINLNTMSPTGFVNLDVGSLLGSFASFCFAVVFKYGVLLQQESDEMV